MVQRLIEGLGSGTKNMLTQKRIITYLMHNHFIYYSQSGKGYRFEYPYSD